MSSQIRYCQACGRSPADGETFAAFLPATSPQSANGEPATEVILCPGCTNERRRATDPAMTYSFCDQCAGPIEPGQVELRSKTSTAFGGAAPFHSSVTLALCPRCARKHDGTFPWLLACFGMILGGVLFLAFLGWLVS